MNATDRMNRLRRLDVMFGLTFGVIVGATLPRMSEWVAKLSPTIGLTNALLSAGIILFMVGAIALASAFSLCWLIVWLAEENT